MAIARNEQYGFWPGHFDLNQTNGNWHAVGGVAIGPEASLAALGYSVAIAGEADI